MELGDVLDKAENGVQSATYKMPPLVLDPEMDVETAARLIFLESSRHLHINFEQLRRKESKEALMQIRIGLRRTRVAMRVFSQIIPPKTVKKFSREFRYIGRLLGEARNMDEFLFGMLNETSPLPELSESYTELRHHAQRLRDEEYREVMREIMGGRFEAQLQAFDTWRDENWVGQLGKSGKKLLKMSIQPYALEVIDDSRDALLGRGANIEERSTAELHMVRKYVKRTRYHMRFFYSLIKPARMEEGYNILVQMQEQLGYVNDVKEGLRLMSRLGGEVQADHIAQILMLMSARLSEAGKDVETHLAGFQALWHRYEEFELTDEDLVY